MKHRLTAAALVLIVAIAVAGSALPAGAHEGEGTIEVLGAEATGPLEVTYSVRLTYNADGHPAADATLTAVAEGPGGNTTPVPMQPSGEEGVYGAVVAFPEAGSWTVRFTAVTPAATLERVEQVAAPTTTIASTTASSTTASSTVPPSTTTAADTDDGDSSTAWLIAGLVTVAVVGALLLIARRRRRAD